MKLKLGYPEIGSFLMGFFTFYLCLRNEIELWQIVTATSLSGIWILMILKQVVEINKEEQ